MNSKALRLLNIIKVPVDTMQTSGIFAFFTLPGALQFVKGVATISYKQSTMQILLCRVPWCYFAYTPATANLARWYWKQLSNKPNQLPLS